MGGIFKVESYHCEEQRVNQGFLMFWYSHCDCINEYEFYTVLSVKNYLSAFKSYPLSGPKC